VKVLISGSHGLVGTSLVAHFQRSGSVVYPLLRSPVSGLQPNVFWDPAAGVLEAGALEGFDVVIHLAGENLASGRWTAARKARIRDSRVKGTQLLAGALARLRRPPRTFLCASAIGIYGNRGHEFLNEEARAGEGFLSAVCQEWEAAAQRSAQAGIRVGCLRFGVILSDRGGALRKMLAPFRLGLGGVIGSGEQFWSWIGLDDVIGGIDHVLATETLHGPLNFVSPQPVTNREFTKTLGRVLRRPTFFKVPRFAARLALGQMADEALLGSQRVLPSKLLNSGYTFRYPDLQAALKRALSDDHLPPRQ
jgi:uncharacterized protein (TIGR01777 family)